MAESLQRLQRAMWALIVEPTGAADALARQPAYGWLLEEVRGDARAGALERIELYANMYFYRLRDDLALDFPGLHALLGADGFHDLITDYLHVCSSRDPSARNVGRLLPSFLRAHAVNQSWPWAADLAALEWARLSVFDRADRPVLRRAELAASAASAFSALSLRWIDAHVVIAVDHDVTQPLAAGHEPAPGHVLVWRAGSAPCQRRLERDEVMLWPELARGMSFVALCDALCTTRDHESAARRALALLSRWTGDELLVAND